MQSTHGWGRIGQVVPVEISGGANGKTGVIGAWHQNRCVHAEVFEGNCRTGVFTTWLSVLMGMHPGKTIIMDNATYHHSGLVQALSAHYRCRLLYLPPYSPDLNPIEHCWANGKRLLRKVFGGRVTKTVLEEYVPFLF
jgi:hypothetical protein